MFHQRQCITLFSVMMAVLLTAHVSRGQPAVLPKNEVDIEKLDKQVSAFFGNLTKPDLDEEAFKELFANGPLAQQEKAVATLVAKTREFDSKYGPYQANERIDARRVGQHLVLMKYLYKARDYPVVWYFTFYHDFTVSPPASNGGNWVLIAVRFDTRLDLLGL